MRRNSAVSKKGKRLIRPLYEDCLQQAEICREQAGVAAGLHRLEAARGLVSTALALYGRVIEMDGGECLQARERVDELHQQLHAAYRA